MSISWRATNHPALQNHSPIVDASKDGPLITSTVAVAIFCRPQLPMNQLLISTLANGSVDALEIPNGARGQNPNDLGLRSSR